MANILIIDDEKSIRRTLREILEYEGYKVEEAGDGLEGRVQAAPVIEADGRDLRVARRFPHLTQLDEPAAVRKRERPQEYGVDRGEDRAVGADAEREGEDDWDGEAWPADECPGCVADIPQQGVHPPGDVRITRPFALHDDVAKLGPRAPQRLVVAEPLRAELAGALRDMERQLAVDVALDSPWQERVPDAMH